MMTRTADDINCLGMNSDATGAMQLRKALLLGSNGGEYYNNISRRILLKIRLESEIQAFLDGANVNKNTVGTCYMYKINVLTRLCSV